MNKDYLPLWIVSGVAVAASAVLLGLGVVEIINTETSKALLLNQKKDISRIVQSSPHPVTENLNAIEKDMKALDKGIESARAVYGHPEKKILQPFAEQLGVSEEELVAAWKARSDSTVVYRSETDAQQGLDRLLVEFISSKFPGEAQPRISRAKARVRDYLSAATLIVSSSDNTMVNLSLLSALGSPCQFDPMGAKFILNRAVSEIQKYMKGDSEFGVSLPAEDYYFTFDAYKTAAPAEASQIMPILDQLYMIESVVMNIKRSHLSSLLELRRLSEIAPKPDDKGFVKYTYELKIRGSLKAARLFLNSFVKAIDKNQFFEVASVKIEKSVKEEAVLLPIGPSAKNARTVQNTQESPESEAEMKKKLKIEKVIGQQNDVDMTIRFHYIVYAGVQPKSGE